MDVMLSIERRRGESLFIGDDINVQVLATEHAFVKLAVRAPRDVLILRGEVPDRGLAREADDHQSGEPMLIIRRRSGETLRIGSKAELIVSRVRASRATLCVSAAPGVRIRRGESGGP
jgi:carbon storage regulator CsrA